MSQQEQWDLDGNPDEMYERHLVPAMFTPWADDFVQRAALKQGERVLDVACGTGVVARLMAPHVGATGKVVALDIAAGRLAVGRSLPAPERAEIEWREGDVSSLPFDKASFDLVCCHQGLQFFPDRLAALQEMSRVLTPGGRLLLSVWRSIEHHPDAVAMVEALEKHVSREASDFRRAIFSLGEAEAIENLLGDAGYRDVVILPMVKKLRFPSAAAFTMRYISAVGPLSRMVSEADDNARDALLKDMGVALRPYVDADGLSIPTGSHLVTART